MAGEDTGSGTDVLDRELEELLEEEKLDDGDHDRYSHYVKKDKILTSASAGNPSLPYVGKYGLPGGTQKSFPCAPRVKTSTRSFATLN